MGATVVSNPVDYNCGPVMADYSTAGTNSASRDGYATIVPGKSHFSDLPSATYPDDRRLPARAASHYEPQTYTAQPESVLNQLDSSLDEIISTTDFSTAKGREKAEEISDRVIRAISGIQDDLTAVYPKPEERANALKYNNAKWINSLSDKLRQSGLTESEIDGILKVLKDDTYVLIRSINEVSGSSSAEVTSLPAAPANSSCSSIPVSLPTAVTPAPVSQSAGRRFYIEPQKNYQCSRHAANAFFEGDILQDDGTYEGLHAGQLYDRMLPAAEKMGNDQAPLALYDLVLGWYTSDECEHAVEALNALGKDGFVLSYPEHFVCFKKDGMGQWWLLDSLHSHEAIKIKPSDYIRWIWEGLDQRGIPRQAISIICRDREPKKLPEDVWARARRGRR